MQACRQVRPSLPIMPKPLAVAFRVQGGTASANIRCIACCTGCTTVDGMVFARRWLLRSDWRARRRAVESIIAYHYRVFVHLGLTPGRCHEISVRLMSQGALEARACLLSKDRNDRPSHSWCHPSCSVPEQLMCALQPAAGPACSRQGHKSRQA